MPPKFRIVAEFEPEPDAVEEDVILHMHEVVTEIRKIETRNIRVIRVLAIKED